jgi:hypothetical protein
MYIEFEKIDSGSRRLAMRESGLFSSQAISVPSIVAARVLARDAGRILAEAWRTKQRHPRTLWRRQNKFLLLEASPRDAVVLPAPRDGAHLVRDGEQRRLSRPKTCKLIQTKRRK